MYLGWLSYAGRELINNNRVAAYARGVTVTCGCDSLPDALGDEPYRHPAQDPAPWFERSVPESGDFWGCVGLEITGGAASTRKTTFTDLINDGSTPGPARREAREIEVKTMLLARTEAGLSWGISWLNAALRGSACKTGCGGDELCVLSGCPEPPPVSADADACDPAPMQPEPPRAVPQPEQQRQDNDPEPGPLPDNRRAPKPPAPEPKPAPAPEPEPPQEQPPPPEPAPAPPPPPEPEPAPAPPPPAPAGPPPAPQGPPPGPNPPAPDPEVAKVIYLVGRELNVSDKVMLAGFEAALVESSCRNLDHGDRDSVGVFQQRPSAKTWGTAEECMNVNHAAHKFFEQTVKNDGKHPEFSAGQLAQATQSSKYPDRYDKREQDARTLIDDTARANGGGGAPAPPPPPPRPEAKPEPLPPPAPPPEPTPLPDQQQGGTGRPPAGSGHTDTHASGGDETKPRPWDPQQAGQDMVRRLYDVALSEFGDEERARVNGAWSATVTFTLKAGNPAWYYAPRTLVDTRQDTTAPAVVNDVLPGYRIDAVARCPQPVDCLAQSPYLQNRGPWGDEPFPGSDPADPVWRDPGFPTQPFDAQRAVYLSPGSMTPGWLERVPIIDVYSGHQDMHRITIRFYANPRGGRPRELDPCDACNEITLPWVPARSKVRMDGRTERVEVTCPDKHVMTSDVVLYGPLGGLLQWPVFDCGTPMIVEVLAQNGTLAADAWYRIQWSAKADAI